MLHTRCIGPEGPLYDAELLVVWLSQLSHPNSPDPAQAIEMAERTAGA